MKQIDSKQLKDMSDKLIVTWVIKSHTKLVKKKTKLMKWEVSYKKKKLFLFYQYLTEHVFSLKNEDNT